MKYGLLEEDIDRITKVFESNPKVIEVVLFGSRAMGNFKLGSDIDLAILSDAMSFTEMLELNAKIAELGLLYAFDIQDINKIKDSDVLDHIHRNGVVFYRRN